MVIYVRRRRRRRTSERPNTRTPQRPNIRTSEHPNIQASEHPNVQTHECITIYCYTLHRNASSVETITCPRWKQPRQMCSVGARNCFVWEPRGRRRRRSALDGPIRLFGSAWLGGWRLGSTRLGSARLGSAQPDNNPVAETTTQPDAQGASGWGRRWGLSEPSFCGAYIDKHNVGRS